MPDHRRAVLGVLGELKAPDAADALQEALDSADEVVRSRVTQCSPPRAPELTRHEWTALWKANGSYQWNGPDAARAQAVERWRAWLAARSQGRSGRR
jgi:HEAT repeat protein